MTGASGLDWGHELWNSLWWIVKAFVITSAVFVAVVAALLRFTDWGRQFSRISGQFFAGRTGLITWAVFAVVMVLTVTDVRLNVLFSYFYNDMYTSLQLGVEALTSGDDPGLDAAKTAFWNSIVVFCVLATLNVVIWAITFWVIQALLVRWRVWLNNRVAGDWLVGRAYYRSRFIDKTIDNPDQRIQQDVHEFVNISFGLAFGTSSGGTGANGNAVVPTGGLVGAGVTIVSFTPILWNLSGPVDLFGWTVPRALVFATFIYVLIATVLSFWIGHPLIRLNFLSQRLTANFRYALVRLRDNAESVAFYRGEEVERSSLFGKFAQVIANYWAIVRRQLKYYGFNLAADQVAQVFTALFLAPRIFSGQATFGDFQQAANAFGRVYDSASIVKNSYDVFTYFRSTLIRLDGMVDADDKARDLPEVDTIAQRDALALEKLGVTKPDGEVLVADLDVRLQAGDALVVKGASGAGKTTLLRSVAQMWPFTSGTVRRPEDGDTLFVSQLPYIPLGDLRTAVCYPMKPGEVGDELLRQTLQKVSLGHLQGRLDEEQDWAKILSPGEQQRVAFARILLLKPKLVFLDEATSAVDEGLEYALYALIREEVPDTMLVSVAHRSTVDQHHTQRLELDGTGSWELSPVEAVTSG